jgi:type IV pilus assembly protein PilB
MKTRSSKNPKQPKDSPSQNKTLLGQILVELGYITIYQLDEALQIQRADNASGKENRPLGQILLELGYCGPNQLIRAIQVQVDYRKAQEQAKGEPDKE